MSRVFLSYHREDTASRAERLTEILVAALCEEDPDDCVVSDEQIPEAEWKDRFKSKLAECDALVVVIGERFVTLVGDPDDRVRYEVATALGAGISVVPLLVDQAERPRREDLTEDLRPLAKLEPIALRAATFERDAEQLTRALRNRPLSFADILRSECAEIEARRAQRRAKGETKRSSETTAYRLADHARPVGLALSGGGIRSATFNLGVLQGLAQLGLLKRFDYLSTVSGGGYIGSWLAGCIKREDRRIAQLSKAKDPPPDLSRNGFDAVNRLLAGGPTRGGGANGTREVEPREIRFLREHSNYLTPRKGLASGDTAAAVATYVINLTLNLLILIPALAVVLLIPHILVELYRNVISAGDWQTWRWWLPFWQAFVFILTTMLMAFNMDTVTWVQSKDSPFEPVRKPSAVWLVALFILVVAWLTGVWLWLMPKQLLFSGAWLWLMPKQHLPLSDPFWWSVGGGLAYCVFWVSLSVFRWLAGRYGMVKGEEEAARLDELQVWERRFKHDLPATVITAIPAGAVGGLLLYALARWIFGAGSYVPQDLNGLFDWVLVLATFAAVGVLHVGFAGPAFDEDTREWWSRLGGNMLLLVGGITALSLLAVYGPFLARQLGGWIGAALTSGWLATTVAGLLAGRREASEASGRGMKLVAAIAPYVFVIGLLLLLSMAVEPIVPTRRGEGGVAPTESNVWWLTGVPLYLLAFAVLASRRIGVNEFSLHGLYRNRLVRCYLGASNEHRVRAPHGFDPRDDELRLSQLAALAGPDGYSGPYPIINASLNLVSSDQLAWQQRKAASFTFTPKFSGYELSVPDTVSAYRPTGQFAEDLSLGTVMAISGAAATPNMGYQTSTPLAFLMSVFNVRLGWWVGNPARHSWRKSGPTTGLLWLLSELVGRTDYRRNYVYLSDGGHFENLGIYELVRRRCRYIVACDAEADPEFKFAGLGNAIEKCRTDFGVDIEIDIDAIQNRNEAGHSARHCAVGKIHYPSTSGQARIVGTLVYIKASVTGDEPTDVVRYASYNRAFPQQTTADQWFDESQFESYRILGSHVATDVFGAIGSARELEDKHGDNETLFTSLRQHWYPTSSAVEASFTKHASNLSRIRDAIRRDEHLRFLDTQLFPEWPSLTAQTDKKQEAQLWLPPSYEEARAGFYVCTQLLQLMQDVYLDLKLESEHDHPDNRGWMNLFQHLPSSGMLRVTWAITASTYGARFQNFCERRLGLLVGEVAVERVAGGWQGLEKAREIGLINDPEFRRLNKLGADDREFLVLRLVVAAPDATATDYAFTFGVAAATEAQLEFYRVRNHLRRMRLGRLGLRKLLDDSCVSSLGKEPPVDVGLAAWRRFQQLFWSVKAELR